MNAAIDTHGANAIRMLAVDAVQQAKLWPSGHAHGHGQVEIWF